MRNRFLAVLRIATALMVLAVASTSHAGTTAGSDESLAKSLATVEGPQIQTMQRMLGNFDTDSTRLARTASVPRADLDRLQALAASIKQQLPAAQRTLSAAVAKIRAAGKWNTEFDALVIAQVRKAGQTDLLQAIAQAGGARALAERAAAASLTQVGADIDERLAELRPRSVFKQIIEPLMGVTVSAWSAKSLFYDLMQAYAAMGHTIACLCLS